MAITVFRVFSVIRAIRAIKIIRVIGVVRFFGLFRLLGLLRLLALLGFLVYISAHQHSRANFREFRVVIKSEDMNHSIRKSNVYRPS